jgi:hypothetical protein
MCDGFKLVFVVYHEDERKEEVKAQSKSARD